VKVPGAASKAFAAPFQIQLVVREAVFRGDQDLLFVLALGFGALAIIQASIEALGGWALFGHLLSFQIVGDSLVSLIDSFGEQLSQVFMLRVFDVDTNC
jgi:ABC-type bacteriocin/lantibiotic exporter with double-glycine peptidase domain